MRYAAAARLSEGPPRQRSPAPRAPALLHAGFERDPQVAARALRPQPGEHILLVDAYGGGEAALAYLAHAPGRVEVAGLVDLEGVRALLDLEVNAVACLKGQQILRLLGLLRASRGERIELYLGLRGLLPRSARGFWDQHRAVLAGGIYSQCAGATLGRLLRNLLWTHLTPATYRALLYGAREERTRVFDEHITGRPFWRSALRLCALRGQLAAPVGGAASPFGEADPVAALRAMVDAGLWSSPVWARAFCNDAGVLATLPAHLRDRGLEAVRCNLDRLVDGVRPVAEVLFDPDPQGYDLIDLCNLLDYESAEIATLRLNQAAACLRPGGRLSYCCAREERLRLPTPAGLSADLEAEARGIAADGAPLAGRRRVLRR